MLGVPARPRSCSSQTTAATQRLFRSSCQEQGGFPRGASRLAEKEGKQSTQKNGRHGGVVVGQCWLLLPRGLWGCSGVPGALGLPPGGVPWAPFPVPKSTFSRGSSWGPWNTGWDRSSNFKFCQGRLLWAEKRTPCTRWVHAAGARGARGDHWVLAASPWHVVLLSSLSTWASPKSCPRPSL